MRVWVIGNLTRTGKRAWFYRTDGKLAHLGYETQRVNFQFIYSEWRAKPAVVGAGRSHMGKACIAPGHMKKVCFINVVVSPYSNRSNIGPRGGLNIRQWKDPSCSRLRRRQHREQIKQPQYDSSSSRRGGACGTDVP